MVELAIHLMKVSIAMNWIKVNGDQASVPSEICGQTIDTKQWEEARERLKETNG